MKKHLLGFAVFSLILGTAIFVAALARSAKQPVVKQYTYEVSNKSCWKMDRRTQSKVDSGRASIKITQAVLNEKTGKMNLSFVVRRETPATQDVKVRLSFVNGVYDGNGKWDGNVNFDSIAFTPSFNVENEATFTFPYTVKWNKNLPSADNFYVTADLIDGKPDSLKDNYIPKKMDDFTPVLITDKNF